MEDEFDKNAVFVADYVQLIQWIVYKETLECSGEFKIGEQVIGTVTYADDLVPLGNEEAVLLGMTGRVTETGQCYGMEMNVEKTKAMRIWRQPTVRSTDCDRSKTAAECGVFQLFG